jgi:PKD repeat protein
MKAGLTFILSVITLYSFAQTENDLTKKFRQKFEADSTAANRIAKEKGLRLKYTNSQGKIIEFSRFSINGEMLFNETHNIGAGRTISTNKVWPGGTAGTSLTGITTGARLGEWDGGAVRITHQEFGGRVTKGDGAGSISDHSTHVAGTMIGAGVVANAKGMAYQGNLKSYDWNADNAEMNTAAAAGMLISNHSYGTITGWYNDGSDWYWYGNTTLSEVEDYKFGFYDESAADWDEIAFNNPNYLICKSAGNDRGAFFSGTHYVRDANFNWVQSTDPRNTDGPYDCVSTYGTAKNILTVGAVYKINGSNSNDGWTTVTDVQMSNFSGWGPTDDGRIKPDVVGTGVSIYSSTGGSNTSYSSLSGTSMATPNVAGSLSLVQQHFYNLKGRFMRAATLKGLIIHTADEAGNAGPDYSYGWGLVNISKAVHYISDSTDHTIKEKSLANNNTYTETLTSNGSTPLRITICWTDRPGTPPQLALDPSNLMLVNDLDIRLKRISDNTIFSPYVLNPANPSSLAATGDNFRDNTEQIMIAAPQPGDYVLTVSHKGTLFTTEAQAFSLFISGATVSILAPVVDFQASVETICQGESVAFTDLTQHNPETWEWTFEGANPATSTAQNPTGIIYNTPGVFPVKLKATNAAGTDSIIKINYIQVNAIPEMPTITTISGTPVFCFDSVVVLSSSADSGNQWYKDGGIIPNANDKTYAVTESGSYTVGVMINDCESEPSNAETLTKLAPVTPVVIHGDTIDEGEGEHKIYSVAGNAGSTYQWDIINGTIQSGNGTDSVTVEWGIMLFDGYISVQETTVHGCAGDTVTMYVNISDEVMGVNNQSLIHLAVHPNPASQLLTVAFESREKQTIKLSLLNVLGQSLIEKEIPAFSGIYEGQLDMEKIDKGIYLLQIEGERGREVVRIIKN